MVAEFGEAGSCERGELEVLAGGGKEARAESAKTAEFLAERVPNSLNEWLAFIGSLPLGH
jgi:hypothetical protein